MTTRFTIFAAAALFCSAAAAQTPADGDDGLIRSVGSADLEAIFQELGYATSVASQNDVTVVEVQSPELGAFYVAIRGCDENGCAMIEPFGYVAAEGVTLKQANDINLGMTNMATFMLLDGAIGVISGKIFLNGGVAPGNFGYELGLFAQDLQIVTGAVKPGALATVSAEAGEASPYSDTTARRFRGAAVNAVGANAATFVTPEMRKILNQPR